MVSSHASDIEVPSSAVQPTRTENVFANNIPSFSHSFHELFGTGIRYHKKSFNWALSNLSDVPFSWASTRLLHIHDGANAPWKK